MRATLALLAAAVGMACFADLDKIDADGVTEVGGSAAYARMLPRTGSDGRLASSLLPPVADWASQPISGLYYVSGGASSEGNGSPQYPFKTLTYAMSQAASGSACIFVPATYSGSMTITAGQQFTIGGFGPQTYVSSLTVSASGSSSDTVLTICGTRIGTLTVNGGRLNVRLNCSTVATLSGSSTSVTVTRADMASAVSAATVAYTDAYSGYQTSPQTRAVINADGSTRLEMTSGRAVVGDETVAYLSDIQGATTTVYATVGELREEDARIEGLVTNEASARASADTGIYSALSNAVASLTTQIGGIGTGWNNQFSSLSSSLSTTRESLASLWVKETNDIATVNASIAGVQTAYVAADNTLASALRGEMSSGLSTLRGDVPGIADTRADARIAVAKPGIVSTAVAQAVSNLNPRITALTTRVGTAEDDISALQTTVSAHTSSISTLASADATLTTTVNNLSARESSDVSSLNTAVSNVQSGYIAADTALATTLRGEMTTNTTNIITTVNAIIDCLTAIQQGKSGTMSIPAKLTQ